MLAAIISSTWLLHFSDIMKIYQSAKLRTEKKIPRVSKFRAKMTPMVGNRLTKMPLFELVKFWNCSYSIDVCDRLIQVISMNLHEHLQKNIFKPYK